MHEMKSVLLTGGAGYVGSHIALDLEARGWNTHVVDNLSTGFKSLVPSSARLWEVDILDQKALEDVFKNVRPDAVIHAAALTDVEESFQKPQSYWQVNSLGTFNLVNLSVQYEVKSFIYSSTAAVYGNPQSLPIDEAHPASPLSPYGSSKLSGERLVHDILTSKEISSYCFRYFNVGGADPQLRAGLLKPKASSLLPRACAAALNPQGTFYVYGKNYPTADGTALRDLIHVSDLARAHVLALDQRFEPNAPRVNKLYNLGYGRGYTVLEVLRALEKLTGREMNKVFAENRQGDIALSIANPALAKRELAWEPQFADLEKMVETALSWHQKHF